MDVPCAGCRDECLSEMFGTYLLVLFGPASILIASLFPIPLESLVFVAAVFGGTVAMVILLIGKHSGAHINPAITVANAVAGAFKSELFVPYVVFQLSGAVLAGLSLRIVFGSFAQPSDLGSTKLAVGVGPLEAVVIEAAGTFVLAFSALSAGSFLKSPLKQAILVGSTLFILILFIGPLTGASFNPARSIGPSLFSGYFDGFVVYLIGPIIGAAAAGLVFRIQGKTNGGATKLPFVCVC